MITELNNSKFYELLSEMQKDYNISNREEIEAITKADKIIDKYEDQDLRNLNDFFEYIKDGHIEALDDLEQYVYYNLIARTQNGNRSCIISVLSFIFSCMTYDTYNRLESDAYSKENLIPVKRGK